MFNTYTNSVVWPRGYKDYCTLLPERSERYQVSQASRCCCVSSRSRCCCCYSSSYSVKPKVSMNPGFVLYGIRQSTLIQWPSFRRRLVTGVGVGDGHCCDSSSSGGIRRNRGFRIRASDECGRSCPDDVEAMISFLSEEMIDEERSWKLVSRVQERYGGNVRRVKVGVRDTSVKRPEGFGRKEYKRNGIAENVTVEEKYDCEHCGSRKKNSHQLESDSRRGSKLVTDDSVGKTYTRNEEREARLPRTKSSSCSSYYSLGSSGDFESDIEDQDEDVELHRESLRSSEKKVGGQSSKGNYSRKEASQIHLRGKRDKTANGVGSSYRKQVFEEAENSNQVVTLNQRRRKQFNQTNNRVSESMGNYEEDMDIHEIHVNDAETSSQNQKYFGKREDNSAPSIHDDSGRENIESSQQQLMERFGARYSSEEGVSEIHRRAKYGSSWEEGINVLQKSPETTNDNQPLVEEKIFTQADMKTRTERFSENSDVHNMLIRNTYVSQSNDQIRNQEANADLVPGLQSGGRQQDYHIEQNPVQKMQSDRSSVSVSHSSDAVRYTEINRKSEKRLIGQGSTAVVELDSKKFGARNDSRLEHANSTKEGQKAFQLQSSQEKLSEEASSSQSSLNLVANDRMHLVNLVSSKMQGSDTTLIPPSSQLVSRGSGRSYGTGGVSMQEFSHETSETGYPTAFENPGAGEFVSSQSAGELMRFTTPEDALGSAHRMEQSSEKFIGEFVKKAKREASTSEIEERRAESNQLTRQESRRASGGSGAKGPSDEMWVTDSAQGTPQPGAPEGNATDGNAIFKRNGRSLWGVIADIARLRWGTRAGSPDSSAKPTGKSSPNESGSSVTWFSGREHDGSSDDNANRDRPLPQEVASAPQLEISQTSPRRQIESSGATKVKQQSGRLEGIVSSPSSIIVEGGSASYHMSSTTGDQIASMVGEESKDFEFRLPETDSTVVSMKLPSRNLLRSPAIKEPSDSSPTGVSSDQNFIVGEGRHSQPRVPEIDAVEKPLLFPGRSLRSAVVKEPSESRPTMVSGSSSIRQQQQPLSAKSQEETVTPSADSVLIQRKLKRNKQVVRDSFEEWEEAYRVEAERRTVDETFMREALVEAKKAADLWEVPVGAVLVHDGKIIARGFNLVEDLRDSTAHAEMICIREGSNVLRSWRLADTTLYVTLEPCPMCAGAILQARVNTVVWGAPNKLLGADGSWIRLFPGGEGHGSEVSEKPPPPVHPFHPKMTIRRGVLESECAQTMQQFFQLRRKKKDKNPDPPTPTDHQHHHPSKLLNKMHQIFPFFCL